LGPIFKRFSVDAQLISHEFLLLLINRTFHLHSNFTLVAKKASALKCDLIIADDLELDGCLMSNSEEMSDDMKPSSIEFVAFQYPRTKSQLNDDADWCLLDDATIDSTNSDDHFELIPIRDDCIVVTVKAKDQRQESFLQKATSTMPVH
jgi:hypothetical protein